MPTSITHKLFAEQVLDKLEGKAVADLIRRNLPAYYWGCIGPDALMLHRKLPWQKKIGLESIGERIHTSHINPTFQNMMDYITEKGKDSEKLLAYFYGYVTHYAIDRIGHPFVFSIQQYIEKDKGITKETKHIHIRIETAIDIVMLRKVKGELPSNYKLYQALSKDTALLWDLAGMIQYDIEKTFGEKYPAGVFVQDFSDARSMIKRTRDPLGIKKPLIRFFEKLFHQMPNTSEYIPTDLEDQTYDYTNSENAEWENRFVPGEKHTESFFDLYDIALDDAASLVSQFSEAFGKDIRASEITGGRSFTSNLVVDSFK